MLTMLQATGNKIIFFQVQVYSLHPEAIKTSQKISALSKNKIAPKKRSLTLSIPFHNSPTLYELRARSYPKQKFDLLKINTPRASLIL